jgi:hypothetical protein
MALDQAFAKGVNDYIHGVASAPTLGASRRLKLCSNTGTSTTAGTEVATGGGYSAGGPTVAFSAATSATPSVSANQAVSITNTPAWGSVASIEITDNAGTPVRIEFGAITGGPKSTNSGDTLSFSAGSITSALQ